LHWDIFDLLEWKVKRDIVHNFMKYIEITILNFDGLLKDLRQILWYVTTYNLMFIK